MGKHVIIYVRSLRERKNEAAGKNLKRVIPRAK